MLDLEELLATRLLVQGNSGSGKSHLLRRLLEQSAALVQQAVIDPEGDFVTLAEKHGHVVVDAARAEADLQRIAARVRQHRVSVVLNLEGLDAEAQMRCAAAFLGGLFDADRDLWYPMLVVVDEAQLFAPSAAGEVSDETRKISLGAMTNLMCRGRKRGLAGIIATQRLAKLAKNVAAEASNFLMGRTFLDIDMARAADLLGMDRRQAEMFRDLQRGHFVALGPAFPQSPSGANRRCGHLGANRVVQARSAARPADDEARDLIFTAGEEVVRPMPAGEPPLRSPAHQRSPGPACPVPAAGAEPAAERGEEGRARGPARQHPAGDPGRFGSCVPHRCGSLSGLPRPLPHQTRGRRAPNLPAFRRRLAVARAASMRRPPRAPNGVVP